MRIKTHPGEVLREEFMVPFKLSASKLSGYLGVPLSRITEIVNEKRGVTADTAVRLAKFFGNSSEFWINLQVQHDLSKVNSEKQPEIKRIPNCHEVAACF
ncbi:HigA family addiction module antitoxin [Desulfovibrio psychrotolerans]|uniref:Transcriptional regulator n=1 Tax=Desulfovibrio psychrotolerans TaxID=415242 RepID=A0A7J0BVH3_9BACT|nr:HigA family addiction module antitoxin [Desulfovibrio psychrotolerans]GFM37716.1 transcriptional regulator [Desulfovibrio psychrotolerans]